MHEEGLEHGPRRPSLDVLALLLVVPAHPLVAILVRDVDLKEQALNQLLNVLRRMGKAEVALLQLDERDAARLGVRVYCSCIDTVRYRRRRGVVLMLDPHDQLNALPISWLRRST